MIKKCIEVLESFACGGRSKTLENIGVFEFLSDIIY